MKAGRRVLVVAAVALSSCGSSLSGRYQCDGLIQKLDFRGNSVVYVTLPIVGETEAQYKVDNDKVSLMVQGKGVMVLTRSGDTLTGGPDLFKLSCKRA